MPTFGNLLTPTDLSRARRVLGYNSHCANATCDCYRCVADHALVSYEKVLGVLQQLRQARTYGSYEAAELARSLQYELQVALRAGPGPGGAC